MRILLTGGTGTISSGLVKECVTRGFEVYALTRGNSKARNIEGAKYLYVDVWDVNSVSKALSDISFDVIVECLAYNTDQLKISLENFSKKCTQYVFISTAGIYNRKGKVRIKESDEKNFADWSYTKNKIECEEYLKVYSNRNGLNYTIIRPTVTYGDYRVPFPVASRNPGWSFFQRMIDGMPMLACDNVKFSVIHVRDFSKAVVSLFGSENAFNEDFHISDNNSEIYWDDVVIIAGKLLGLKPNIIHVPVEVFRKVYPAVYEELLYNKNLSLVLDDTKLKEAIQFEARIDIYEGIRLCIEKMQEEYIRLNYVDDDWNRYCNAAIMEAYQSKALNTEEYTSLAEYFSVSENYKRFKSDIRKVKLRNALANEKTYIKKLLKR